MALTWDVTNIVDHERVTTAPFTREGRKQWHPATEALVWLSVHCGYSRITEENINEIADRIRVWETYIGATMMSSGGDLRVSLEDIRDHVGLTTNASTLTKQQFWSKVRKIMEREASLGKERMDRVIRRSFERRVDVIAEMVSATEGVPEDIDVRDQIWHWFDTAEDISVPDTDIATQVAMRIVHA